MKTLEITYKADNCTMLGYLAYDDKTNQKRPAVIVAHAFEGRNELMCQHAENIAKQGYVGFAIDMYGDAAVTTDFEDCMERCMALVNDRATLRKRVNAAFDTLAQQDTVDASKIAGIGFCLGGMCVLDLARSGTDIKGVVSVHGVLAAAELPNEKITAKVLALHGFADPQGPAADALPGFGDEMTAAGADWQMHVFGDAKHAFTDPHAATVGPSDMGREYHPLADRRSWRLAYDFFEEVFL